MWQQAVEAVHQGATAASVAAAVGVNIQTVFGWLADYPNGGQRSLLAKPIPGRPPKLSWEQVRWVAETVRDDKAPWQMKLGFVLWTLLVVGEVIDRQFGVRLTKPSIARITRIWGYTPQKPWYRAWPQDPVWVERWQTAEFPDLKAEANRVGAVIFFGDEAGIRSDHHAGRTWAPYGQTPVIKATGRRFGLNTLSAGSP